MPKKNVHVPLSYVYMYICIVTQPIYIILDNAKTLAEALLMHDLNKRQKGNKNHDFLKFTALDDDTLYAHGMNE